MTASPIDDLRRGWHYWCTDVDDEGLEGEILRGWNLAASANDMGGDRPVSSERMGLTVEDL